VNKKKSQELFTIFSLAKTGIIFAIFHLNRIYLFYWREIYEEICCDVRTACYRGRGFCW
jgi:hypothetical protein